MKKQLLVFLLLLILGLSAEVNATNFYVINLNDSGTGSLRQAILDANAAGGATSNAPHVIAFDILGEGTVVLATELPALNNHITIQGQAEIITLAAGPAARIVTVNNTFTVIINRLIFKGGNPTTGAGAIFNQGRLTLNEVTLTSNSVTGPSQGGAISNSGTGNLTIRNSTLNDNSAMNVGGAIVNYGDALIESSTIYGNSANEGAGIANYKNLSVYNCTITKNTGGGIQHIVNSSSLTLLNTLLVGNTNNDDLYADVAANVLSNNSLIGVKDALVTLTGTDNITATAAAVFGTNVLTDNGGFTETINLATGSPAIDAGQASSSAITDQIGQSRTGAYDIGALEHIVITSSLTRLSKDAVNIFSNPGHGWFEVELDESIQGVISWKVVDRNGRLISNGDSFIKGNGIERKTVDLSKQASDNYLLILSTEKATLTKSLIKL